jgi:lysophospholipase L1-like esterase
VDSAPNEEVGPGFLTVAELRAAWLIVGVLLAVSLGIELTPRLILVGVPWLAGAAMLARGTRAERIASGLRDIVSRRLERLALIVLVALLLVAVQLVSLLGALMMAVPLALMGMLLAGRERARGGSRLLVAGTLTVVVIALLLFAAELVLRIPAVAWRTGGPIARQMVEARYDQIWLRNIFGVRSRYETVRKPPGVRRIVSVGDSFTFGALIPHTDSIWTSRLERLLWAREGEGTSEIINLARNGYTTANEAEVMRRIGWQFDPDLVIVQFLANDALPSQPNFGHEDERRLTSVRPLLPATFLEGTVRSSALLAFTRQRVRDFEVPPFHLRYIGLYTEGEKGWQQLREGLREIGDSARARNVPVVFAIHPMLAPGEWTPERYPLRGVHEQVAAEARKAGMHVLDVTQAFMAEGGDWRRWWVAPYDSHPNSEGHALIARYTLRFLDSLGVVGARTSQP